MGETETSETEPAEADRNGDRRTGTETERTEGGRYVVGGGRQWRATTRRCGQG